MNSFWLLEQGVDNWNEWRAAHPDELLDLEAQDLSHGYFFEGDFRGVNLRHAKLQRACLVGADFRGADLTGADFTGAYLSEANFYGANLHGANLTRAALDHADIRRANLAGTNLSDTDISTAKLPEANEESYASVVAMLISQSQRHVGISRKIEKAIAPEKNAISTQKTKKETGNHSPRAAYINPAPSAFEHIVRTIKNFTHESSEDFAARQQRIRQSAIPERRSGRDRRNISRHSPERRQTMLTKEASLSQESISQKAISQKAERLQPVSTSTSQTSESLLSFLRKPLQKPLPAKIHERNLT
ncbi:MAG: pentapeptide repeat-containing protein [Cyanobacteria bacterium J06621_3]